jgi:hypothetical protein
MRNPGAKPIIPAAIVVVIGAAIAWFVFSTPPRHGSRSPDGTVTFLGYTNDASCARLARFGVTNLSAFAVARAPKYVICARASGGVWTPQSGFLFPEFPSKKKLGAGGSEAIAIPPPPNQSPWRVSFYLSNDAGHAWVVKRPINAALVRLGLPPWYGVGTMQVDSGPIEDR